MSKKEFLFFMILILSIICVLNATWYLQPFELEKRITALEEKCK